VQSTVLFIETGSLSDYQVQSTVLLFLSESNGKFVKVKIVQVLIH